LQYHNYEIKLLPVDMKNTILILLFTISSISIFGQCNMKEIEKTAEARANKMISIKTLKLDLYTSQNNEEFSYVLGKDVEYMFALNSENGDNQKVLISLYNNNKKLIATNFNEKTNTYTNTLIYKCPSTKMYYITMQAKDNSKCMACVIAFRGEAKGKKLNPW